MSSFKYCCDLVSVPSADWWDINIYLEGGKRLLSCSELLVINYSQHNMDGIIMVCEDGTHSNVHTHTHTWKHAGICTCLLSGGLTHVSSSFLSRGCLSVRL